MTSPRPGLLLVFLLGACGGKPDGGLVVVNTEPSVIINTPGDGATFDEKTSISFVATVADNQDPEENLEITWTVDNGVAEAGDFTAIDGKTTFVTANLSPGNHAVSVRATDSGGKTDTFSIGVSINDLPEAPEITIVRPAEGEPALEGDVFEFVAEVSDAIEPADSLVVSFVSDKDGTFCEPDPDATGVARCTASLTAGTHLLTFEVTDGEGITSQATRAFAVTSLADDDGDGDGWTENQGDCNDDDGSINPGEEEIYNDRDDDCDEFTDEGTSNYDDDGDGLTELQDDCDDTDPTVYPGAPESGDGVDDDCDGVIDEGTELYDDDGDGYTESGGDCDDACFACSPRSSEIEDALDNDCDGVVDEGTSAYDDDGDGYTEYMGDCDDSDYDVNPVAAEACGDGVDNDCNGDADEENAVDCDIYYMDIDGDGFGSTTDKCLCAPSGYYTSPYSTDCYDGNASANTSATTWYSTHRGDGSYDYNCDGSAEKYYPDKYNCSSWPLCGSFTAGWKSSVPSCGSNGTYVTACSTDWTSCSTSTATRTQKCR
jgi:hypothetical protein